MTSNDDGTGFQVYSMWIARQGKPKKLIGEMTASTYRYAK